MRVMQTIADLPGVRRLFDGLWWLPGQKTPGRMASASLLLWGERPLLIDAGMRETTAQRLREAGIVQRLHLTHMHLDHRVHQDWFFSEAVTAPVVERDAIADWDTFFRLSGFPPQFRSGFDAWRQATIRADAIPHTQGVEDGQALADTAIEARILMLPGHTAGHSGLWFPELRAALVTDYDMEAFGPWYGNTTSDLDEWILTLETLLGRDDLDWFITSHSRGMLDRETFTREAARYLRMIDERDAKILDRLQGAPPAALRDLVGHGVIYPPRAIRRFPVFAAFERRMIELHLERLAKRGAVVCEDGSWTCA